MYLYTAQARLSVRKTDQTAKNYEPSRRTTSVSLDKNEQTALFIHRFSLKAGRVDRAPEGSPAQVVSLRTRAEIKPPVVHPAIAIWCVVVRCDHVIMW